MIFQQPIRARILSRVMFYAGVFGFLWYTNTTLQDELEQDVAETRLQGTDDSGLDFAETTTLRALGFRNL